MSLKFTSIPPIPEETAGVARAVFPRRDAILQMRDLLGTIYTDELFADLFPTHGHQHSLFQSGGWDTTPSTITGTAGILGLRVVTQSSAVQARAGRDFDENVLPPDRHEKPPGERSP